MTGVVRRNANTTVFLSGDQSIPNDSNTKVAFDTTDDGGNRDTAGDDFGAFDTTNNRYVVPTDGDYRVDVTVEWCQGFPAGTQHDVRIFVSGFVEARWTRETPRTGGVSHASDHGSTVLMGLQETDTIRVEVYQDSGSDVDVCGGSRFNTHASISHVG